MKIRTIRTEEEPKWSGHSYSGKNTWIGPNLEGAKATREPERPHLLIGLVSASKRPDPHGLSLPPWSLPELLPGFTPVEPSSELAPRNGPEDCEPSV